MEYIKPKCDCGNELMYMESTVNKKLYMINKDGIIGESAYHSTYVVGFNPKLYCLKCKVRFELCLDEENRAMRDDGDEYDFIIPSIK